MPPGTSYRRAIEDRIHELERKRRASPNHTRVSRHMNRSGRIREDDRFARFTLCIDDQAEDTTLCQRCKRIDFGTIFGVSNNEAGFNGLLVYPFGLLRADDLSSPCPLCAFFASMVFAESRPYCNDPAAKIGKLWSLNVFGSFCALDLRWTASNMTQKASVILEMHPRSPFFPLERRTRVCQRYDGNAIVPVTSSNCQSYEMRPVVYQGRLVSKFADYVAVAGWIDQCRSDHKACESGISNQTHPKRLIDCCSRFVEIAKPGSQYFCLSYVWGQTPEDVTAETLGIPDRRPLPHQLPQTIEDAITCVVNMGKRYLWVDRLCIDQDPQCYERTEQISRMAEIFEEAEATIVALGYDADSGLPGVGTLPRQTQPHVRLSSMTLVSTMSTLPPLAQRSQWSTRGWTYQEAVLSRRCIVFTAEQMFFVCRQESMCESIDYRVPQSKSSQFQEPKSPLHTILGIPRRRDGEVQKPMLSHYIHEYTKRNLSREEDVLNAFRGILARCPHQSYWGLPIYATRDPKVGADICFCHGLLWYAYLDKTYLTSTSAFPKRAGFPTWSWASSRGIVSYGIQSSSSHSEQLLIDEYRVTKHAKITMKTWDGHLIQLSEVVRNSIIPQHRIIPENGRSIYMTSYVTTCRLVPWMHGDAWLGDVLWISTGEVSFVDNHTSQGVVPPQRMSIRAEGDLYLDRSRECPADVVAYLCGNLWTIVLLLEIEDYDARRYPWHRDFVWWMLCERDTNGPAKRIGLLRTYFSADILGLTDAETIEVQ